MFDTAAQSMPFIRHIEVVDSTHKCAIDWLNKEHPPEGSVVWADYQTAGIGRFSRSWSSNKGQNILSSHIYYPHFLQPAHAFMLNMAASMSVYKCLKIKGIAEARIKWPNDVLVDGKKIAGILIHNQLASHQIKGSVISIGLNVNQQEFQGIEERATSMALCLGQKLELAEVFSQSQEVLKLYYDIIKYSKEQLRANYLDNLLGRHTPAQFITSDGEAIFARIQNIGYEGALTLLSAGETHAYGLNELRQLYDKSNDNNNR